MVLVEKAISTDKHMGRDDALIISSASIYSYTRARARKILVVAKGRHVDFYRYPKEIIEEILNTPHCWYSVIDFNAAKLGELINKGWRKGA